MADKIIFDPAKDLANSAKHGLSLAEADRIDWDTALTWVDTRRDYGETRIRRIGYIGVRLHFVVFMERHGLRRIISLRKTNEREDRRYAQT